MLIAIAGNIGSGKTTLAGMLAKHLNFEVHYEDPENNPYISDFYADMKRWSFHLQMFFLHKRSSAMLSLTQNQTNVIQDRTLYEDAEIFAHNLNGMGLLSTRDYETYLSLYSTVIQLIPPPDLIIYLKSSVSNLVEQIQQRARPFEDSIRLDYLRKLNERYDLWFQNYDLGAKMEINIDELKFRDNPEHFGIILNRINSKLFGLFD